MAKCHHQFGLLTLLFLYSFLPLSISAPLSYSDSLLTYLNANRCPFPRKVDLGVGTPVYSKLNHICDIQSEEFDKKNSSDPVASICFATAHILHQVCIYTNKSAEKTWSGDLAIPGISNDTARLNVSSFCKLMVEDGPKKDELPSGVQGFYEQFLVEVTPHKENSCLSVCANKPVAEIKGDEKYLVNPLCALFKKGYGLKAKLAPSNEQNKDSAALNPPKEASGVGIKLDITKDKGGDASLLKVVGENASQKPTTSEKEIANEGVLDTNLISSVSGNPSVTAFSYIGRDKKVDKDGPKKATTSSGGTVLEAKNNVFSTSTVSSSVVLPGEDDVPPPPLNKDGIELSNKPSSVPAPKEAVFSNVKSSSSQPPSSSNPSGLAVKPKPEDPQQNFNNEPGEEEEESADYDMESSRPLAPSKEKTPTAKENAQSNMESNVPDPNVFKDENSGSGPLTYVVGPSFGDNKDESGGVFNYFLFFITFLGLCFLVFHNKRRLIAYVVEGKKPRGSRNSSRRNSVTSYRRLENVE